MGAKESKQFPLTYDEAVKRGKFLDNLFWLDWNDDKLKVRLLILLLIWINHSLRVLNT